MASVVAGVGAGCGPASTQGRAREIGMYVSLRKDPEAAIKVVREVGSTVCEVFNDDLDEETRRRLMDAAEQQEVRILALFSMGPGEMKWDFMQGPSTIGLVPRKYRQQRIDHMKKASDFAAKCGIPMVETHFGFVPESPNNPLYEESVEVGGELASYCKSNDQDFLYHAGQETPVVPLSEHCEMVLVVEDDPNVREVTLQRVEGLGYVALEAENAEAAIRILEDEPNLELVFSDVVLGHGMSGYELGLWVRANKPGRKVLLTTGYASGAAGGEKIAREFPVLRKPYSRLQLALALKTALDSKVG